MVIVTFLCCFVEYKIICHRCLVPFFTGELIHLHGLSCVFSAYHQVGMSQPNLKSSADNSEVMDTLAIKHRRLQAKYDDLIVAAGEQCSRTFVLEKSIAKLREEQKNMIMDEASLQTKFDAQNKECEKLQSQLGEKNREILNLEGHLKELKDKNNTLNLENGNLGNKIGRFKQEIAQYKNHQDVMAQYERKVGFLVERFMALSNEKNQLENAYENQLFEMRNNFKKEAGRLGNIIGRLRKQN